MSKADFEQAMGETFSEYLSPPIPFEQASAHECCEAIFQALRPDVTPEKLGTLGDDMIGKLAKTFADYFEADQPDHHQIRSAIVQTLVRWPVGSLSR